jgi:hypothetical protein
MDKIDLSNIEKNYTVEQNEIHDGKQIIYRFPNGYGARVVDHSFSYGLEIAVLDSNDNITYDTPITDDVIGYNTPESAAKIITEISKL